jgi:TRAP-type C4-dicarboxylate transport system substrate-binding protein
MKVRALASVTFLILVLLLSSELFAQSTQPIVWRCNSWPLASREEGQALQTAADEVFKRSASRLKIDVYPQFSLGIPWTETLRAMKDGVVEMSMVLSMYMGGEEPFLNIPEIPGIWKHKQQSIDGATALENYKRNVFATDWNTYFIPWGHMVTYWDETLTRKGKPVRKLEDFKGMKIRVPNPRYQAIYLKLGASPQMIPPGDVYMAMQTGVIDGYASASCYSYDGKLYEVAKYDVPLSANLSGQQDILISNRAWKALAPDLQQIVQEVFAQTRGALNKKATATDVDLGCRKKMREAGGVEYNYLSQEDLRKYRSIALECAKEWVATQKGRVVEAWDLIQPVLAREYVDAMEKCGEY